MAAVAPYSFLDVAGKIFVHRRFRSACFQGGDYLRDHPAHRLRRPDDGDGAVIRINHDFNALPDLSHDGGDVFVHIGLSHVYDSHTRNHTGSSLSPLITVFVTLPAVHYPQT